MIRRLLVPALVLLVAAGCGSSDRDAAPGDRPTPSGPPLRAIVRPEPVRFLPRNAEPVTLDRDIVEGLAAALGRPVEYVVVDDYGSMIDRLLAGDGDLVAASVTVTPVRSTRVDFSIPYLHVDELLVVPEGQAAAWEDMNGRSVCVRPGSSYEETLLDMVEDGVAVTIEPQPVEMATEVIVDRVAAGDCPATVVDSNYWSAMERTFDGVEVARTLADDRGIALVFRPDDDVLRRAANEFLVERALIGRAERRHDDDLAGIRERGRLRMITRNSAATYYLHRGTPYGFDYELLARFAEKNDLRLEIVIPPSNAELIPWLREGRGDVVAALLTITSARAREVEFTRPYVLIDEVVVTRADDDVAEPADLAGRSIHIRPSSSYRAALEALLAEVEDVRFEPVPETMPTEEILARVESGEWDVTIADSNLLELEQTFGRDLRAAFTVAEDVEIGWAVRDSSPELREALDEYIRSSYRGLFYNMRKARYFENRKSVARGQSEWRTDRTGRLSPYDELARRAADRNHLDWRLLVAQMYQESQFHPNKRSWAGARGLMQVLPRTAREVGVSDWTSPEGSVEAGARYLRRMIDLFDPKLPYDVRVRFALASYNAGRGHVQDARRLARKLGDDPDRWYGNAESAMLLLSKRKYHRDARFGYVRGSEPVAYVREIEDRYRAYVTQLDAGPREGDS